MVVNTVDVVVPDAPLPKLPVARALWIPRPNFNDALAAWIYAGGAHHTGFSLSLTAEYMEDFAAIGGIEFLRIDETTTISQFKQELHWNDAYYLLTQRI
jgi:L-arabinose isomerase